MQQQEAKSSSAEQVLLQERQRRRERAVRGGARLGVLGVASEREAVRLAVVFCDLGVDAGGALGGEGLGGVVVELCALMGWLSEGGRCM